MLKRLTFFTFMLALGVIVLGAYTRLTDAGLGCPDWPGCYGHLLAPIDQAEIIQIEEAYLAPVDSKKAWTEMVHRYFASSLGLFILIIAFLTFKNAQGITASKQKKLSLALCILVIFQGLLGMWTVTLKLFPLVVMAHLLGGFLTVSLLWSLSLLQKSSGRTYHSHAPKTLVGFCIGALVLQIALGAWTSANYASLSCPSFPYCAGNTMPHFDTQAFDVWGALSLDNPIKYLSLDALQTIHMTHRLGALIVSLLLIYLTLRLIRTKQSWQTPELKQLGVLLLTLLFIQVGLGITNVVALLPLSIALLHHGVAALMLLVLLKIFFTLPSQNPA